MIVDRACGIDLGTTNSEIAVLDASEQSIAIFADRFGRKTVPSAVAWYESSQSYLVGHAARARRGQGTVESIKRKMGKPVRVPLGPHELLPEEVSAKILGELRARMREQLAGGGESDTHVVDRAVITVPAYFDAHQVEATRKAGELAGLDVVGILQEPTAAAIYHTWKSKLGDGTFLVYDLGGGTFDVSILRCVGGEYQVLAIDGDNYLGGDDFDRRFAEHLRKELVRRGYKLDLDLSGSREDQARFQSLVYFAQQIKESLSTTPVLPVHKPSLLTDQGGEEVSFEGEISRSEYEATIADLVESSLACCARALAQSERTAAVTIADIDHVVLVGGSTRVPLVFERVTEELAKRSRNPECLRDDVDTCVALGAAIHAAQLGGLRLALPEAEVTLRSPLVSSTDTLRLVLSVDKGPAGVTGLEVERDGTLVASHEVMDIPSPRIRLSVPLGDGPEQPAKLALVSDTQTLATFPLALRRGDMRPRASELSRASVVAKDISIEVVRAGKRERRVLIPRGTGLPEEVSATFATSDQSGAVVLRLLQNRLPIKTLVFEVDRELPVGTPVELLLRCDESMRIEAHAEVAGRAHSVAVEPVHLPPIDTKAVEALLEQYEERSRAAWGHHAKTFRREADLLVAAIRESFTTDPDRLESLCQRLSYLIEDNRGGSDGSLSPSREHFDGLLDRCKRAIYSNDKLLGVSSVEWEARLAALIAKADAAYEGARQTEWSRVCNEAQALKETLTQAEFSRMKLDDPAQVSASLVSTQDKASRLRAKIDSLVLSEEIAILELQHEEQNRLRTWIGKVERELSAIEIGDTRETVLAADRKVDQAWQDLSRIELAVDRIYSIGVVADRSL